MGYISHNTIVVTSSNTKAITDAHKKATEIGLEVLGPSSVAINGYQSIFVCPDGSKEGWHDSQQFDEKRKAFRDYLDDQRYEDNSSSLEWAEIAYGSDDRTVTVVDNAWTTPPKDD
jgi:hypothetical protein